MKILFMHNTIPEYRIQFMKALNQLIDVDFFITDREKAKDIYSFIDDIQLTDSLKIIYATKKPDYAYIKRIVCENSYTCIVLPPADNYYQLLWGCMALQIAKKKKIKTVYWSEKWEADKKYQPVKKRLKNLIQKISIRYIALRCDTCIASGYKSKEYLLSIGIKIDKIYIAYDSSTSLDGENTHFKIKQKYNIPIDGKIILYLGRLIERKGCIFLLEAFKNYSKDNPNTFLMICGSGEFELDCKEYVKHNNVQNVIFVGNVAPGHRIYYYDIADVFVLPSYSKDGVIEAWGLTVNEALERGVPVIATTAVGAAYDLLNPEVGEIVEEQNSNEIKEAFDHILGNDNYYLYEKKCKEQYKKYSVEEMAKSFNKIFNCMERK